MVCGCAEQVEFSRCSPTNIFNKKCHHWRNAFSLIFPLCLQEPCILWGLHQESLPANMCAQVWEMLEQKNQLYATENCPYPAPVLVSFLLRKEFYFVFCWTSVRHVIRVINTSVIHFMILFSPLWKDVETIYLWTTVSPRFDNRNVVWRKQTWISPNKIHQALVLWYSHFERRVEFRSLQSHTQVSRTLLPSHRRINCP